MNENQEKGLYNEFREKYAEFIKKMEEGNCGYGEE